MFAVIWLFLIIQIYVDASPSILRQEDDADTNPEMDPTEDPQQDPTLNPEVNSVEKNENDNEIPNEGDNVDNAENPTPANQEQDEESILAEEQSRRTNETMNKILYAASFGGNNWPYGIVKYRFKTDGNKLTLHNNINFAISTIEVSSCLQFEYLDIPEGSVATEKHILIMVDPKRRECQHTPEWNPSDPSAILIYLGLDCLSYAEILHTLLHGVGFVDEVTHNRRDLYVSVQWNNIEPKYHKLFAKDSTYTRNLNMRFDPQSVMMFHDRAFSSNGELVVKPMVPGLVIRPFRELSPIDITKLHIMFQHECNMRKVRKLYNSCQDAFDNKGRTPAATPTHMTLSEGADEIVYFNDK